MSNGDETADSRPVQATTTSDSITDLAQQPIVVDWVKYVTVLFAFTGIGFFVFELLADALDESVVEASSEGFDGFGAALDASMSMSIMAPPYFAILAAVFVGAFLGWRLVQDDKTTLLAAALAMFAGTLVFWVVSAFLGTIQIDGISVDFAGLLLNSIVAGVGAAVAAAGGVWASRNLAPETIESR